MCSAAALPEYASVVVIGGGIMGCSTLYHLAKLGVGDAILLAGVSRGFSPPGPDSKTSCLGREPACTATCNLDYDQTNSNTVDDERVKGDARAGR